MAKPKPRIEVRRIGVSEFKAHCLAIFDELDRKGGEVVVTKRGREVATVKSKTRRRSSFFGCMKGKIKIKGDIVHFDTAHLWEVLK